MIKNLIRSPNCVLMLPKLAISFSIKLVNLVFVFRANCKSPLWVAFWDVHFPRKKPSAEIVAGQIKINVSLERPLQARWASFAFDFPLAKSVQKIIAAHQMKTLMRLCLILYRQRLSSIGNNSVTFQGGDSHNNTVFAFRFTTHMDNEAFCY